MRDGRRGQLDPVVVPVADLGAPLGIRLRRFVDDLPEALAQVDAVVHAVQVDLGEHGAAAVLADGGVVVPLRLPFDQDIADVEDDRLDAVLMHPPRKAPRRGRSRDPP
jgi:hypothetical protein